jgi:hypothetical protein
MNARMLMVQGCTSANRVGAHDGTVRVAEVVGDEVIRQVAIRATKIRATGSHRGGHERRSIALHQLDGGRGSVAIR